MYSSSVLPVLSQVHKLPKLILSWSFILESKSAVCFELKFSDSHLHKYLYIDKSFVTIKTFPKFNRTTT